MTGLDTICAGLMAVLAGTTAAQPGSVPPDTTGLPPMTDIHDIKSILDLGGGWPWGISLLAAVLALLLLALAWWLWKRRRRPGKREEEWIAAVAPDQEALAALDALTAETAMAPRQFYFRLSAILRRYVERRYHFPAAEMTTEELLPHLDRLSLDGHLVQMFKAFCREADPIKFAGAVSRSDRVERNLAFCRDFVRRTTAVSQDDAT